VLWALFLLANLEHDRALLSPISLVTGIEEILLSGSVALPGVMLLARWAAARVRLYRIVWLWNMLTVECPEVVLGIDLKPRTRWPILPLHGSGLDWKTYRSIVEINDAIAELAPYSALDSVDRARGFVDDQAIAERSREPIVAACWLAEAVSAQQRGMSGNPAARPPAFLFGDARFLAAVSWSYRHPAVTNFLGTSKSHSIVEGRL
jgi:hypothetical protein